ncbi:MAG: FUSC family membrane protein [Lautropia sp.]|nr:FUSC family membrane protein [Lautropia sp.]
MPKPNLSPRLHALLRNTLGHFALNGITSGLGLLLISFGVGYWLGPFAASVASIGVVSATPPDTPAPRRGKFKQMLPAVLIGLPLFYGIQRLAQHPVEVGLMLTAFSFVAFLAMAWGKRGISIAMGMMFTVILSLAVGRQEHVPVTPLQSTAYFGLGAGLYVLWATLTNLLLNGRYRALLMADVLISLAELIRTEAQLFRHQTKPGTDDTTRLQEKLLRAQATLAEQMQAARDIVLESPRTAYRQRIAGMLVIVIDIRDTLLASELDLDNLCLHARHRHALTRIRAMLDEMADEVDNMADALLFGLKPRPSADRRTRIATIRSLPDPENDSLLALGPSPSMLIRGLAHRIGHINDEILRLSRTARGELMPDLAVVRANWQMFVSPTTWSIRPFLALWGWKTPQLRHAIRAALAMGTGYAIALAMPWGAHDYWILLTIAVVLRGSLSQTIERRDQRVAGTLVGCLLAMGLLSFNPGMTLLLVVMMLSQGISHSFSQRRYLLTSVAGTVLGLIQVHLVSLDDHHTTFTLMERFADTLLGAVVAWAFCYVLPSWERGQIPALVKRTLEAQARHARLALDPQQLSAVENTPELAWRLARREAFDSLSALVQATQRSLSEPRAVRPPIEALQYLQLHCYQFLAQLSAIKSMLVLRRDRLNADEISEALTRTTERIEHKIGTMPIASPLATDAGPAGTVAERIVLPDPFEHDISPWMLRRLDAATAIAIQIRDDAVRVQQDLARAEGF